MNELDNAVISDFPEMHYHDERHRTQRRGLAPTHTPLPPPPPTLTTPLLPLTQPVSTSPSPWWKWSPLYLYQLHSSSLKPPRMIQRIKKTRRSTKLRRVVKCRMYWLFYTFNHFITSVIMFRLVQWNDVTF